MKNKHITIMANSVKDIQKMFDYYKNKYGNITLSELCEKFKTDMLVLN